MPSVIVVVTRHSILGARRFDRVGDNLHDTSHIYHVSLAELPRISSERDLVMEERHSHCALFASRSNRNRVKGLLGPALRVLEQQAFLAPHQTGWMN